MGDEIESGVAGAVVRRRAQEGKRYQVTVDDGIKNRMNASPGTRTNQMHRTFWNDFRRVALVRETRTQLNGTLKFEFCVYFVGSLHL